MNLLSLLVNLLPTVFGLMHTAEAVHGPGQGEAKKAGVLDALGVILGQFPGLAAQVEPVLAVIKPIMAVYVALSNVFGWNPAVAALAQQVEAIDLTPAAPDAPQGMPRPAELGSSLG